MAAVVALQTLPQICHQRAGLVVAKGLLLTELITLAVMERLDKVITAVLHTERLIMLAVVVVVRALLAAMARIT